MRTLEEIVSDIKTVQDEKVIDSVDAAALERASQYRLSDAIREGSAVTKQAVGWGDGESACALSAAALALKARGYLE